MYNDISSPSFLRAGPIDGVIYQSDNYHILKQNTISGTCRTTGDLGNITAGSIRVQFSVQDCPRFGGFVYDAYTGWNSVSRILIEEVIPRALVKTCLG